ncbi:neprilysin-1 [Caerostris extrusa]|uniref:Neprilysin-1 n=1 Tax=Caerostris extrusa TaxID=172846 RepID=A0AAV4SFW2_CAEEX|nr:neprilysin-1 [Caerostris extrusa]
MKILFIFQFDWVFYLNTFLPTKVDDQEPVVVYALPYLQEMGQIISQANRRTIHNYALWRLIKYMLPFLDGEYSQKRTEFNKILLGISAERERWNQCVDLVNKKMGMAVGALFIRDNFDPKSKETAQEMILNIREAFNELLEENAWMDKETREVARDKANAMNERIGYPDLLTNPVELSKEYEGLTIHDDLFLVNILNVFEFEAAKNLKKLRQPVNKDRWTTEPAVVNAFYNPNKNDIVFQLAFFSLSLQSLLSKENPVIADACSVRELQSLNYGGIGVVIGHEMTHGFDDKGRQFDKEGNLKQWWNEATVRRFRERAQCIIDQYSSYVLEDIGLNAYKKWVKRHGEEPLLPGLNLTHDQLFFLNYAQIWCGSMRPEDALNKVRSSVHSPGPIRVLGPLSNSYDFAKTYNCPIGSRMNPKKKCSVW